MRDVGNVITNPSFIFSFVFESAVGVFETPCDGQAGRQTDRQTVCVSERLFKGDRASDLKYSSQIKSKKTKNYR